MKQIGCGYFQMSWKRIKEYLRFQSTNGITIGQILNVKLYQDIINAFDKDCQHFTGTLVYIDDVNGGSGLNEVLIIDGQQRITTIYILLKALYDASKGVLISVENEIADVIFNRHCDEKYKVKLKPVKTDNEQLTYLVKDKIDEMDRNSNV